MKGSPWEGSEKKEVKKEGEDWVDEIPYVSDWSFGDPTKIANEISLSKFLDPVQTSLFLTGSRSWGSYKEHSDYDYLADKDTFNEIVHNLELNKLAFAHHRHYSSIYIGGSEGVFNIIGLDEYELEAWKFATRSIKGMVRGKALDPDKDFSNKNKVYGLFQALRGIGRMLWE